MSSILHRDLLESLCPEVVGWEGYTRRADLKIAVVGFGKMGLLHSGIVNLLIPNAVKAIVDKSILITFGISKIFNSVKFYRNLDGMLDEAKPDAVYVTTPTPSHYPIAKHLLERGINYIFIEKPPTTDYETTYQILSRKKSDQHIMVGFQKRFALTFRHAKLLIDSGIIGEVVNVYSYIRSGDILKHTNRFNPLGRGVLLDLGVHLVDLLSSFFKIKRVRQAEYQSMYTRVDDFLRADLETEDCARVSLEATWSDPEYRLPETYIEVQGTHGTLKVTEDYLKVSTSAEHPLLGNKREIALYKPHYYQGIPPVNLADPEYTLENIHFLRCIYEGGEPLTSIENSLSTMRLIDEIYEKAKIRV